MKRPPKKITAARLSRITGHYLERYATSRAHLRRLLMRRVVVAARHHGTEASADEPLVEVELDRLEALNLVDDGRYARDKAGGLRRRGASSARVRASLFGKGVASEAIAEVLAGEDDDAEINAAMAYLRRRSHTDREVLLGRLVRAGFSYSVARRALELGHSAD